MNFDSSGSDKQEQQQENIISSSELDLSWIDDQPSSEHDDVTEVKQFINHDLENIDLDRIETCAHENVQPASNGSDITSSR